MLRQRSREGSPMKKYWILQSLRIGGLLLCVIGVSLIALKVIGEKSVQADPEDRPVAQPALPPAEMKIIDIPDRRGVPVDINRQPQTVETPPWSERDR